MGLFDIFRKTSATVTETVNTHTEHNYSKSNKPVEIECLFDYQTTDTKYKVNIEYIIKRESENLPRDRKKYLLYACQPDQDKTCCFFAEVKNNIIYIYVSILKNNIIRNTLGDSFEEQEFFGYDKNEFLGKLFKLKKEIALDTEIKTYIWSGMMKIFPEYSSKATSRKPIYEKYFPYPFDNLIGAENYINSGMLYKIYPSLKKDRKDWTEFQSWRVYNRNQDNETMDLVDCSSGTNMSFSDEQHLAHFTHENDNEVSNALASIPHRQINIDNQESRVCGAMHFSADYRELHVYKSKSEKTIIILKIYSVYNGHPLEGGRMEGYTFNKILEIPSEQYTRTDEELIAEYSPHFTVKKVPTI